MKDIVVEEDVLEDESEIRDSGRKVSGYQKAWNSTGIEGSEGTTAGKIEIAMLKCSGTSMCNTNY